MLENLLKRKEILYPLTLILIIFIAKVIVLIIFGGSDWEPDSYMHFLELNTIYRDIPNHLNLGLGVWTKPLFAFLLAIPVTLINNNSIVVVQIFNLGIFSLVYFLIYKIVKEITKNEKVALLAIVFSAASFFLFKSSVSALTEPIFTLTLAAGFYFVIKNKLSLASLFIGLSVLGRIEGLFFIGIFGLWLVLKKENWRKLFKNWSILILPTLVWSLLGTLYTGSLLYLFDSGYPTTPGLYGFGSLHFYIRQFIVRDPLITFFFFTGFILLLRKIRTKFNFKFELWLLAMWSLLFIAIQSYFWWRGIFGSAGLMRYFISIIPFMIILGSWALNILLKKIENKKIINYILGMLVVIQLLILPFYLFGIKDDHQDLPIYHKELAEAGYWIKDNVDKSKFIYADRPEVLYYAERDLRSSANTLPAITSLKSETIYVWSWEWGVSIFKMQPEDFIEKGATLLKEIDQKVYIFEYN